jgi:hypothetical protein
MKTSKQNRGFYISVGILGVAIIASGILFKREADKAKELRAKVVRAIEDLSVVRNAIPTDEYKQHLEEQKEGVEAGLKEIVREALKWNYPLEEATGPRFQGQMLWKTIDIVTTAAKARQIIIGPKAKYLGFDEYAVTTPGPEENILQLQKELSAATDIIQLLIVSDVYSIDLMARREGALVEEGRGSSEFRYEADLGTSIGKRRPGVDFYDTVPFRVQFSCTYPSLAFFQRSLITPGKVAVDEDGILVKRPRNFLVVNDLCFRDKGVEGESQLSVETGALERTRSASWALTERGMPPELADIPGGVTLWDTDKPRALELLRSWRVWSPEEKEIYRKTYALHHETSIVDKERLMAEIERLRRESGYRRQLEGRPPEYSIIEVTMLIDLIQFNDKMLAELEPGGVKGTGSAGVTASK